MNTEALIHAEFEMARTNLPNSPIPLELTAIEARHLLSLLDNNTVDGWYFGVREQWFKAGDAITAKLKRALHATDRR